MGQACMCEQRDLEDAHEVSVLLASPTGKNAKSSCGGHVCSERDGATDAEQPSPERLESTSTAAGRTDDVTDSEPDSCKEVAAAATATPEAAAADDADAADGRSQAGLHARAGASRRRRRLAAALGCVRLQEDGGASQDGSRRRMPKLLGGRPAGLKAQPAAPQESRPTPTEEAEEAPGPAGRGDPSREQKCRPAPEEEDAGSVCNDGAAVEEVAAECRRHLDLWDASGAEKVLVDAIGEWEEDGADSASGQIEALRSTAEYSATLELLRKFEKARSLGRCAPEVAQKGAAARGKGQWKLGAELKMDLEALGFSRKQTGEQKPQEPVFGVIKIFYRVDGKNIDIRIDSAMPTSQTDMGAEQALVGFAAMWEETALWETWHPVIAKGGAVDLGLQGKHRKLWHIPSNIFFKKEVAMQEVFVAFDHNEGAMLMVLEGHGPDDELWQEHKAPAGFSIDPVVVDAAMSVQLGSETTTFAIQISGKAPVPIPDFLAKWATAWLLPEMTKRMLKAAAKCTDSTGAHAARIRADRLGTYAACRGLVAGSAAARGPARAPEQREELAGKHRSQRLLLALEAALEARRSAAEPAR